MSWINEHKRLWQTAVLLLLLLAIIGPWVLDQIYVPAEYNCPPQNPRINENFCGTPISGLQFFFFIISNFFTAIATMVTGEIDFLDLVRELLFTLLFLPLFLPVFITLRSILQDRQESKFAILAWGLAAGISLFIGLSTNSSQVWLVWGIRLHTGIAVSALILELIMFKSGRKSAQLF